VDLTKNILYNEEINQQSLTNDNNNWKYYTLLKKK